MNKEEIKNKIANIRETLEDTSYVLEKVFSELEEVEEGLNEKPIAPRINIAIAELESVSILPKYLIITNKAKEQLINETSQSYIACNQQINLAVYKDLLVIPSEDVNEFAIGV